MSRLLLPLPMEFNHEWARLFYDNLENSFSFGRATITFTGGTPAAGPQVVTHSLGKVPVAVVGTADTSAGGGFSAVNIGSLTQNTFSFYLHTTDGSNPANGTVIGLYWIAIG